MDIVSSVVASIRSAELSAELYRTARELLDLAGDNGQVKISKQAMMTICRTESEGTMRRQLGTLKRAGIIHVSTNNVVHVSFVGFPTVDQMITARAPTRAARAPTRAARAPEITPRADSVLQEPDEGAYENDEMITARAPTRAGRAPVITPCALPIRAHTRGDRLIDRSSDPILETINQSISPAQTGPQRTPRQPWEAPLSYQLLTDKRVAMRRIDAERLAAAHPFHHIRDAVACWWDNRKSAGGRFEDYPGIVVYWLDNPDESVIPVMSEEFACSQLCRDYRTPDEAQPAAGEEEIQPATPPAPAADPDLQYEPEEGTPAWVWQQVCEELDTFGTWLSGTHLQAYEEEGNGFTIALPDADKADWIRNRLARQIKRKLSVITRKPASVEFIIGPRTVSRETQSQGD